MFHGLSWAHSSALEQSTACGICQPALHSMGCSEAGASRRSSAGGFAYSCCVGSSQRRYLQHLPAHVSESHVQQRCRT